MHRSRKVVKEHLWISEIDGIDGYKSQVLPRFWVTSTVMLWIGGYLCFKGGGFNLDFVN